MKLFQLKVFEDVEEDGLDVLLVFILSLKCEGVEKLLDLSWIELC